MFDDIAELGIYFGPFCLTALLGNIKFNRLTHVRFVGKLQTAECQ